MLEEQNPSNQYHPLVSSKSLKILRSSSKGHNRNKSVKPTSFKAASSFGATSDSWWSSVDDEGMDELKEEKSNKDLLELANINLPPSSGAPPVKISTQAVSIAQLPKPETVRTMDSPLKQKLDHSQSVGVMKTIGLFHVPKSMQKSPSPKRDTSQKVEG